MFEPEIAILIKFSSSEDSGKSARMHRLNRNFAARTHKVWTLMKAQVKLQLSISSPTRKLHMHV